LHLIPVGLEQAAPRGQGHRLIQVVAITDMVAPFVVGAAEAAWIAATVQRRGALFDAAMVFNDKGADDMPRLT